MSIKVLEKFGYSILNETAYNYKELLAQKDLLSGLSGFNSYLIKGKHDDYGRLIIVPENTEYCFRLIVDKNKKYHFGLDFAMLIKYGNIDHDIISDAVRHLDTPNYIGSFNQKKVNDWIEYLCKRTEILESVLAELQDKKAEIENSINAFIASVPTPKVYRWDSKTEVKCKAFTVTFSHHRSSKSLSTNIQYHGGLDNVVKFENI